MRAGYIRAPRVTGRAVDLRYAGHPYRGAIREWRGERGNMEAVIWTCAHVHEAQSEAIACARRAMIDVVLGP